MDSAKLPAVVKDSVSCIWTIFEFNHKFDRATSPHMVTNKNKDQQFVMFLDWQTKIFDLENVLLALHYYPHESELTIVYRVSILDWNFEKQYTREYRWDYSSSDKSNCNITDFISLQQCKGYLLDEIEAFGALRLQVEIDVYDPDDLCCNNDDLKPPKSQNVETFNFTPFLENGQLSDVTLLVGEHNFKAHKVILSAQSETFRKMFCEHDLDENVYKVAFDGISCQVMEQMLNFIYTGKMVFEKDEKIDGKFALDLYNAADKFCIEDLKTECENKLTTLPLTIESSSGVLLFADANNRELLKAKCIEYIVEHSSEIMLTDGWKQLTLSDRIELIGELFNAMSLKSSFENLVL